MLSVLAAIDVVLVAVNLVITGKVITNISPELVISVVYQWRRQPLYALLLYVYYDNRACIRNAHEY